MMRRNILVLFVLFLCLLISGCEKNPSDAESDVIKVADSLAKISLQGSPNGIVMLPASISPVLRDVFVKYTRIIAPNGKPIHFLAQAGWTEHQILKARNVLQHLLADFPDSVYGSDKSDVANSMSNRNACMVLFNTEEDLHKAFDGPLRKVDLSAQDLRGNENPAEGDEDYMNHITRDASFEEIWHLVHDNGIKQTRPEMLAEMRRANDAAEKKGWRGWPDDEPQEHPNEYVGVLLDNYYDLWAVRPQLYESRPISAEDVPAGKTHFGRYFANSREKLLKLDPDGYVLVEKFFHPYLTYTPILPEEFTGIFSLRFNPSLAYTHKSQRLKNVTLSGTNNANILGNALGNVLTGNAGDNVLTGGAGDDVINGRDGNDTAAFQGAFIDYAVSINNGVITVSDKVADRDGQDTLKNIEILKFSDRTISL